MNLLDHLLKGGAAAILGFIVLFLLGAVPGAPSPFTEVHNSIALHDVNVLKSMQTLRAICYRLPDNPRYPCE